MNAEQQTSLQQELLANAFEFLFHGIEDYSVRENKYRVLDLVRGVELLLKWRLARIHWALLYKDIDKANETNFRDGDFNSVGMDECLKRLEKFEGLKLSRDDREILVKLKDERNRIEHFFTRMGVDKRVSLVIDTWHLVVGMCRAFEEELGDLRLSDRFDGIAKALAANEHIRSEINQRIDPEIKKICETNTVITCPKCKQPALPIRDRRSSSLPLEGDDLGISRRRCLFCLRWYGDDEPLFLWAENIQEYEGCNFNDAGPHSAGPCPKCEDSEMYIRIRNPEPLYPGAIAICFNCAHVDIPKIGGSSKNP